MARTKRPLTDAERDHRRAQQRELVVASIEQLRTSDGWQAYLKARRTFHDYSWRNVLLILQQRPTATRVAGFHTWLKLGYCVRKRPAEIPEGQWAIRIWARCEPSRARLKAWQDAGANPNDRPRPIYKLVNVFAQDQITPLPPPAEPAPLDTPDTRLTGQSHADLFDSLVALADQIGYSMTLESDCHGAQGYCDRRQRRIAVDAALEPNGRVATGIHEVAHALLGLQNDTALSYAQEELVVETVAFCVADSVGLDASAASIPYLTGWAEHAELEVLEHAAELTDQISRRIEDALTSISANRDAASIDGIAA